MYTAFMPAGFSSAAWAAKEDITNADITRAVESALIIDPAVSSHLIDVSTKQGIVTLSGSVENLLCKEWAVKQAERVKGVQAVVANVKVNPVSRPDRSIRGIMTIFIILINEMKQ